MTFQVTGILDDTPYEVQVGDDGQVHGSRRVAALLEQYGGQDVPVTPAGPVVEVGKTPRGVLACLLAKTRVVAVDGDAPRLTPPRRVGSVH